MQPKHEANALKQDKEDESAPGFLCGAKRGIQKENGR